MHQLVICGVCAQRLIRHTSNFTIKLFKLRFANVTKSSGKNCITIWRTLKIAERRCFTPGVSKCFVYFHELRLSQSSSYYVHCFCSAKTHCTLPCFTRLFACPSKSILRRLTLTVYWCTAALFIISNHISTCSTLISKFKLTNYAKICIPTTNSCWDTAAYRRKSCTFRFLNTFSTYLWTHQICK